MKQIQTGIIGLGGIGRQFLTEMQNHDSFTVTASWDPDKTACAAATTAWPDLTISKDADQILSDPAIDMIYIASPPDSHCDYIVAAIDAGKAIYCEKPLGINLDRSRQVAARVAESGLPNVVNFNHGRALSSCLVEEKIQGGVAGRISGVDIFVHLSRWPRDFQETAVWLTQRGQGGFTREILSHWIYLSQRLFGPGKIIYKNVSYPLDDISAETRLTAELDFNGIPLYIKAACGGAGPVGSEYTIWGDNLSFRLKSGGYLCISDNGTWIEETSNRGAEDRKRTLDGVAARMAGESISMPNIADALAVQELIEEILR